MQMDDPMMSAAFQPQSYQPTPMEFPTDLLEPVTSPPANNNNMQMKPQQHQQQASANYYTTTDYSSPNDSGISGGGVALAPIVTNEDAGSSSSMHFLSSALTSTVNDCMGMDQTGAFVIDTPAGADLLDDFEPTPRTRCNTWPCRRPDPDQLQQQQQINDSPLMHERIPEEEFFYSRNGSQTSVHLIQQQQQPDTFMTTTNAAPVNPNPTNTMNVGYELNRSGSQEQELNYDSSHYSDGNSPDNEEDFQAGAQKRTQTRRNAWGNMSYADLITQAILSAPDQRLTLSQVYEWMVQNVPYFADKGDSNSSAGWKNSIRHNLSLHSRFMRIQNEGAGKSSWWVINPEALKQGRNQRRRATMDATTKHTIEKKRRGARKRVEMQMQGSMSSLSGPRKGSQQYEQFPPEQADDSDYDSFRSRTLSNMSDIQGRPGVSQVSPTFGGSNDDFKYPAWNNASTMVAQTSAVAPTAQLGEILDRTDQICLDSLDGEYSNQMGGTYMVSAPVQQQQQQISPTYVPAAAPAPVMGQPLQPVKQQPEEDVKPPRFQNQQASYQELSTVRVVEHHMQNPLLRTQYSQQQQQMPQQQPQQQMNNNRSAYPYGCNGIANQQRWQQHTNNGQQQQTVLVSNNGGNRFPATSAPMYQQQQNQSQQPQVQSALQRQLSQPPMTLGQPITISSSGSMQTATSNNLPKDLENVNTFVVSSAECNNLDEMIRQEFPAPCTSANGTFDF